MRNNLAHSQKVQFNKQKDQSINVEGFLLEANLQENQKLSSHIFEYIKFFQQVLPSSFKSIFHQKQLRQKFYEYIQQERQKMHEELQQNQIRVLYNLKKQKQMPFLDFSLSIQSHSQNWEIVVLRSRYGIYEQLFTVLNVKQSSLTHHFKIQNIGTTSQIFFCKHQNQNIAIKCQRTKKNDTINQLMIFRQFFILKLLSSLKLVAEVKQIFGFDLIVYPDCIQFAVEICQKNVQQIHQSQTQENLFKKLKLDLFKIHCLNFVHCDIKPANILESVSMKKKVFLDFGLSQYLSQKIGQNSLASFKGTYNYCGTEMKNMMNKFKNKQRPLIDLYYNDVQSLELSFKQLKNILKLKTQASNFNDANKWEFFCYHIKSSIQKNRFQQAKHYSIKLKQINQEKFEFQLISFMNGRKIERELYQFCKKTLHNHQFMEQIKQSFFKGKKLVLKNNTQNKREKTIFFFQGYYNKFQNRILGKYLMNLTLEKQQMKKILLSKDELFSLNKNYYQTIFIKFISHEKNDFQTSIEEKVTACKFFNEKFLINSQNNKNFSLYMGSKAHLPKFCQINEQNLQELVLSVEYLLGFIYQENFQGFTLEQIKNLIIQAFMLGFDFQPHLWLIFQKFIQINPSLLQKINLVYDIAITLLRVISHKLFFNHQCQKKSTIYDTQLYELICKHYNKQKFLEEISRQLNLQNKLSQEVQINNQILESSSKIYSMISVTKKEFDQKSDQIIKQMFQFKKYFAQKKFSFNESQKIVINELFKIVNYVCYVHFQNQILEEIQSQLQLAEDKKQEELNLNQDMFIQDLSLNSIIVIFLQQLQSNKTKKNLVQMDQILRCQSICLTLYTPYRLKFAILQNDFETIKKILILFEQKGTINFSNVKVFMQLIRIIQSIPKEYQRNKKLIDLIVSLGQNYFIQLSRFIVENYDKQQILKLMDSLLGTIILNFTISLIYIVENQDCLSQIILFIRKIESAMIQTQIILSQCSLIFYNGLIHCLFQKKFMGFQDSSQAIINYLQVSKIFLFNQNYQNHCLLKQMTIQTLCYFFMHYQSSNGHKISLKYFKLFFTFKMDSMFIINNFPEFFNKTIAYFILKKQQEKIIQFIHSSRACTLSNSILTKPFMLKIYLSSFPLRIIIQNQENFNFLKKVTLTLENNFYENFQKSSKIIWQAYIILNFSILIQLKKSSQQFNIKKLLYLLKSIKYLEPSYKNICLQYVFTVLSNLSESVSELKSKKSYFKRKKFQNSFRNLIPRSQHQFDENMMLQPLISLQKTQNFRQEFKNKIFKKLKTYKQNSKDLIYPQLLLNEHNNKNQMQIYFTHVYIPQQSVQFQCFSNNKNEEIQKILIQYAKKENVQIQSTPYIRFCKIKKLWTLEFENFQNQQEKYSRNNNENDNENNTYQSTISIQVKKTKQIQ